MGLFCTVDSRQCYQELINTKGVKKEKKKKRGERGYIRKNSLIQKTNDLPVTIAGRENRRAKCY